eukprot:GHVU01014198.1.p1 GENE.GHVU01014198.1~~GHVU01014198.1.p1  ORF type:complete len:712 (+),score=89.13 GHVU01014198.1:168-2138(+)
MGNPNLLLKPTDSEGNLCGVGDYSNRPYLFFFNLIDCTKYGGLVVAQGCPTPQVCMAECPKKYWSFAEQEAKERVTGSTGGRSQMICKDGVDPLNSKKSVVELVKNEDCAAYYVESEAILNRCMPSALLKLFNATSGFIRSDLNVTIKDKDNNDITGNALNNGKKFLASLASLKEVVVKIYADVTDTWWLILVGLCASAVLALVWILLMVLLAQPMVWLMIIAFLGVFGFLSGFSFYKYVTMRDNPDHQGEILVFTLDYNYYLNLYKTWLGFGIAAGAILLILLIVLLFLRKRIVFAIAVIQEASRAVRSMMSLLVWPIIPFVLLLVLFSFWGASMLYLASVRGAQFARNMTGGNETDSNFIQDTYLQIINECKQVNALNGSISRACQFLSYDVAGFVGYLQIFMLVMLLWVMNFIIALGEMTLAGAFASWYWSPSIRCCGILGPLWRCLRYHIGSLAFGSFILTLIKLIRYMLEYIDQKFKKNQNTAVKYCMCCLKCIAWCIEKLVQFINKNAYIWIAIHGTNFCTGAGKAFMLLARNILRVVVLDKVTDFLLFLGKLVVVAVIGVVSFYLFSGSLTDMYTPQLNYFFVPAGIIVVGAYGIASGFFNVYAMGVDTLFLCLVEDLERSDGSEEKKHRKSRLYKKFSKNKVKETAQI